MNTGRKEFSKPKQNLQITIRDVSDNQSDDSGNDNTGKNYSEYNTNNNNNAQSDQYSNEFQSFKSGAAKFNARRSSHIIDQKKQEFVNKLQS